MTQPGSLTVVGTGICAPSQITSETRTAIEVADVVHYVVPERHVAQLITSWASHATDMADLYDVARNRGDTYQMMEERILADLRRGSDVCAVFYGHPGAFVDPSHPVVAAAREEGYPARMLPGISAADCLYADLGLDPGAEGIQMYSATDFLLKKRRPDPHVPLVLWQMAFIGAHTGIVKPSKEYLPVLTEALLKYYPSSHDVALYEAATIPGFQPIIVDTTLGSLPDVPLRMAMTLVVPPIGRAEVDTEMMQRLGIALAD